MIILYNFIVLYFHYYYTTPQRIKHIHIYMGYIYDLGFSFFSFHKANKETPETLTTLNLTLEYPLALPLLPKPANKTSSFRQQSSNNHRLERKQ